MIDAEVAHVGHPVFDLAFFLAFPLLTAVAEAGARRPPAASSRRLLERLRAPRAGAHAGGRVAHGAHRRDGARAHGRPLAGGVPRRAARVKRARKLGERLLLDPRHDLAAVVASCA